MFKNKTPKKGFLCSPYIIALLSLYFTSSYSIGMCFTLADSTSLPSLLNFISSPPYIIIPVILYHQNRKSPFDHSILWYKSCITKRLNKTVLNKMDILIKNIVMLGECCYKDETA